LTRSAITGKTGRQPPSLAHQLPFPAHILEDFRVIPASSAPRVIVIGGSLGGTLAALALGGVGCDVQVFERIPHRLEGQGAGLRIVAQLDRLLRERAGVSMADASAYVSRFRQVDTNNRLISDREVPGQFTSWGALHRAMSQKLDPARYHPGEACVGIEQLADGIELRFASGRTERADLAVFADGIMSTGRRILAPDVPMNYAGYVTWRGFVPETTVSDETRELFGDAVTYCVIPHSHMAVYPIPDPSPRGTHERFLNFVWYRNVAAGADYDELLTDRTGFLRPISLAGGTVQKRFIDQVKADAVALLSRSHAEVVVKTEEPFLQALYDVEVERMVYGRACLIGDAAFVSRPHAGAATTKAGVNAWRLADLLDETQGDVDAALKAWEPDQLKIGSDFVDRNRRIGNRSLVESRFDPNAPEHQPGLLRPGEA
jgi:2,6-dihydroxypyridine 3-monooxygenase